MEAPRPDRGPTVHVVMRKEDLDPGRIAGKTVVVVDVLFATTTIVAVLDHGAAAVYPVEDAAGARALAARAGMENAVLAGETMFRFIEGFEPPTPLALCRRLRRGDNLIYATTNGTVALKACARARRVLAGCLVNASATAAAIGESRDGVLILCAGTAGAFNLEDFYGAGCLVDLIAQRKTAWRLTDAAQAARALFRTSDAGATLRRTLVGRLMHEWGLDSEVAFAARIDDCDVTAELRADAIRACDRPRQ